VITNTSKIKHNCDTTNDQNENDKQNTIQIINGSLSKVGGLHCPQQRKDEVTSLDENEK
jgi:hypothetical protein